MSSKDQTWQCPHSKMSTPDKLGAITHINQMHEEHKVWFKCDICLPVMVVNSSPELIVKHYKDEHSIVKSVETVRKDCEVTDEETKDQIFRGESCIFNEKHLEEGTTVKALSNNNSISQLVVSEMSHWYTCSECYVSNLFSSKIALVKHYKDEHNKLLTTRQASEDCVVNDPEQIKQMLEEGRVEGVQGPSTGTIRLTIKTNPFLNRKNDKNPEAHNISLSTSQETTLSNGKSDDDTTSKWGMNHQQNYTSLISRAAQRKFGRSNISPATTTALSRSDSAASQSRHFSPDFFKDEEIPDAPIISPTSSTM